MLKPSTQPRGGGRGLGEGTSTIILFLYDVNVAAGGHLGWAQVLFYWLHYNVDRRVEYLVRQRQELAVGKNNPNVDPNYV